MPAKEYVARCMEVYADSSKEKEKYIALQEKAGAKTLSRYLLNIIRNATSEENRPFRSKDSLELKQKIAKLEEDIRLKNQLIDNYQQDIKRLRNAAWLEAQHEGSRSFDGELLQVLKADQLHDYELLEALHIDLKDSDAVKIITNQLTALEEMGFIKKTTKGWKWLR